MSRKRKRSRKSIPMGAQMFITLLTIALLAGLAFWAAKAVDKSDAREMETEVSLFDL